MVFLTDSDRQRISDAIESAEEKTSGELVTAIATVSDGYRYIPILFAAALALLVLPVAYFGRIVVSLQLLMVFQLGLFMLSALIFRFPPIRRWIVPRAVQRERAERRAYETFFTAGVHRASHRAGILIFVSIEERYVRILADEGVDALVGRDFWRQAVSGFVSQVKAGKVVDGFVDCINRCGEVLREHFPAEDGEPSNELPNHLILIDGEDA